MFDFTLKEILDKVTIRNPFLLSDWQRLITHTLTRVWWKQVSIFIHDVNEIGAKSLENSLAMLINTLNEHTL